MPTKGIVCIHPSLAVSQKTCGGVAQFPMEILIQNGPIAGSHNAPYSYGVWGLILPSLSFILTSQLLFIRLGRCPVQVGPTARRYDWAPATAGFGRHNRRSIQIRPNHRQA